MCIITSQVIYSSPPLWLTRNFPWCFRAEQGSVEDIPHTTPLCWKPQGPLTGQARPPYMTGWVRVPCDPLLGHHDDHHDALLPWLVMLCHRQPEWFPVYRFPYKLGGHCLKQNLLMLKGEFDVDNGGYWKQKRSHLVMYLKMLWIIEGWSVMWSGDFKLYLLTGYTLIYYYPWQLMATGKTNGNTDGTT